MLKMADKRMSNFDALFTMIFCGAKFCVQKYWEKISGNYVFLIEYRKIFCIL